MKKLTAVLGVCLLMIACEKECIQEFRYCWACTMTTTYSGAINETTKTTEIVRDKTQDEIRDYEIKGTFTSTTLRNGEQLIVKSKTECAYIKP